MRFFFRYSRLKQRIASLDASLQETRAAHRQEILALHPQIAALHAQTAALHAQIAALRAEAARDRDEPRRLNELIEKMRGHQGMLERLLTGPIGVRPPGVAQ